ncbi:FadR/GntR family transcriptional regulator [Cytobacillus sp. FJAT-53684]|uniref:FadR/GntR family transcriptional regulator n=1 Tax=Cytobacillus mangrovibacter TaxID=3299024 RepID=A0ABW6JWZ1_9BACI
MNNLPKLSRLTLVDRTVDVLYQRILNGSLKPGDKLLGEVEMGKQLGVARTTVREAYSHLIGLGIVERKENGIFVATEPNSIIDSKLSSFILMNWELKQFYEARRILESELVTLAAERATPEDINRLNDINEYFKENGVIADDYWEYDRMFHLEIAKIADNDILYSMYKLLMEFYKKFESDIYKLNKSGVRTPYITHKNIIEAIANNKPVQAKNLVYEMLSSVEKDLVRQKVNEKLNPDNK